MVVYIEYAFLENFLLDGTLLGLAAYAAKVKCSFWKLCLSAMFGAFFALLFPLMRLSSLGSAFLKWSVGFLLCVPIAGRLRTKKDWRRYGVVSAVFFGLSFGFGGALLGSYNGFSLSTSDGLFSLPRIPSVFVFFGFVFLSSVMIWLTRAFYARKVIANKLYTCAIFQRDKKVRAVGFLDSGNLAMKNGLPVCFLSPDILYDLWGQDIVFGEKNVGQVCDEMKITTVAGERIVPLYFGEIAIEKDGKEIKRQAYFAVLPNSIAREYKVLLNARVFEGSDYEMDRTN